MEEPGRAPQLHVVAKTRTRLSDFTYYKRRDFPGGASGKEPAYQCRRLKRQEFDPWEAQTIWYFFFFFFSLENPLGRRFDFYLNKASTQCKYFISVGSVSCSVVSDSLGPMDCSLPGSVMELIHGILQVRILEGLAIPSSRGIFPT